MLKLVELISEHLDLPAVVCCRFHFQYMYLKFVTFYSVTTTYHMDRIPYTSCHIIQVFTLRHFWQNLSGSNKSCQIWQVKVSVEKSNILEKSNRLENSNDLENSYFSYFSNISYFSDISYFSNISYFSDISYFSNISYFLDFSPQF